MNEIERLLEFVAQKGWTKAEFARRMGIVPQDVNKYLNGKLQTKNLYMRLMEQGCDINYLMTGEIGGNVDAQMVHILKRNGVSNVQHLERLLRMVDSAAKFAVEVRETMEVLGTIDDLGGMVRVPMLTNQTKEIA